MTPKRVAAYIGLASVSVAWIATAAGVSFAPRAPQDEPRPVQTAGTQVIADEVQAQTMRLRNRMAIAPTPHEPFRNPFAFAKRAVPVAPHAAEAARADDAALALAAQGTPAEPPLQLIGMAENATPDGVVRTAMIVAGIDDLFMVTQGETIGGRYKVTRVGQDAVELTDLVTGAVRRLALQ